MEQHDAAEWFEKNWTSRKGRWTNAHVGPGNVRTNNSTDAFIGNMKNTTLGAGFRNTSMPLQEFMRSLVDEVTEKCKEHFNMLVNSGFETALFQMYSM